MSLRRRLLVGILALLVVAIAATDVVTYSYLRSFLVGRLDEQIDATQTQVYRYVEDTFSADLRAGVPLQTPAEVSSWLVSLSASGTCNSSPRTVAAPGGSALAGPGAAAGVTSAAGAAGTSGASGASGTDSGGGFSRARSLTPGFLERVVNPDVYVEILTTSGVPLFCDPSGTPSHPDPTPLLPPHPPVQAHPRAYRFGSTHGPFAPESPSFDTGSVGAGTRYRAQALVIPGGMFVTAMPLTPTQQTLDSLVRVELIVSVLVLLLAVSVALLVVRLGLRPLEDMTDTARSIAAGDLTRRVRDADERTEVGRLGSALNGMLSQIEAAFVQRTASERRLRRFAADASHELRTPLTSIRGYAELLRKNAIGDEAGRVRAAQRIEREAARMGLLVDDLLLLARLDQRRPLEKELVELGPMVEAAVEDARTAHPDHPVDVRAAPGVFVVGEALRLRQIADNLLANAVAHTPAGTPVHVTVSSDGAEARLEVDDEGPGLDPEQAERVFDRFYRVSSARTAEGVGLGLSIVAGLAEAHAGSATVETSPGSGARFIVTLPAVAPPSSGDGTADVSPAPEPAPAAVARAPGSVPPAPRVTASPEPGNGDEGDAAPPGEASPQHARPTARR